MWFAAACRIGNVVSAERCIFQFLPSTSANASEGLYTVLVQHRNNP